MADSSKGKRIFWGLATVVLGAFFLLDLVIPDPIPLLDEIIAGILTAVSGIRTVQEFLKASGLRRMPRPSEPPGEAAGSRDDESDGGGDGS